MESYGSAVENVGNFVGPTDVAYAVVMFQMILETTLMMNLRQMPFYVIYVIKKSPIQNGITQKQGIDGIVLFAVKIIEVSIFIHLYYESLKSVKC